MSKKAVDKLKSYHTKGRIEAGCDEAGRGCLAGPVFAATVILPEDFYHPILNDSKIVSEKKRTDLREVIEKEAIAWAVAQTDNHEIDKLNILRASIISMHKAIEKLNVVPEFILVDGNKFYPYKKIAHACIVKGDGIYASIAAASILAKTYRDDYMAKIHDEFPQYDWQTNKGYPTKAHRKAIEKHGVSKYHRMSFKLIDNQLKLDF